VSNSGPDEQPQEAVDRLQREVAALRRSRRRLAEAADADRRAIEHDLHDGVQQHLVALAINLQRLARMIDRDPGAATALIGELASDVREAMDAAMELAQQVYPSLLGGRGLASAIRSATESAGVTVVVDTPASAGYPAGTIAAVYWSCVDTLTAATHGSQATVMVSDTEGALTFEISIEGRLDEGRIDRLRDRIEALDGRLTVDDRPDGGARVHGWLPLSR
jgi:signal transduction histidine kinase